MPPEWLAESGVSGVIARVDSHSVRSLRKLRVPVVDVRCRRKFQNMPRVDTDDQAVARLAFNHLRERGFEQFAFCGYAATHYATMRLKYFREFTRAGGFPLSIYESPSASSFGTTATEQSGISDSTGMTDWLQALEPPTGLFVCNDIRGQQVLNVCRLAGIDIPDSIGVVSVDDDEAICPLCDPPLSSVQPDAQGVGYRAAEILCEMMVDGVPADSRLELVPPKGVTRRLSTQILATADREVAQASRFIREHACEGIKVADVAKHVSISRRQLERRFRTELKHTIHEEITATQIARVKQLLTETDLTLEQLAPLAGYDYKELLSNVFKRETGETPGEFRRRNVPSRQR
jgi:LacI family transcriptional regulator